MKKLTQPEDTKCKDHPDAPHGFNRNASLTEDRYVCDCEYWDPPEHEWVGLTVEDYAEVNPDNPKAFILGARWAEAKLREKNT